MENSVKPVVPQPNTVMHPVFDGSPTFCGGGQCVICVSLILHLTYTPAYNMNPLSVLCKLINLKTKVSLTVRALFDNSLWFITLIFIQNSTVMYIGLTDYFYHILTWVKNIMQWKIQFRPKKVKSEMTLISFINWTWK